MAEIKQAEEGGIQALVEEMLDSQKKILKELRKVIVGQDEVIEQVLISLYVGGHCLITGLPGLAKTRLVETLGTVLGLDEKRIQCTPDLMPADILGSEVLEESELVDMAILARELNMTTLIEAHDVERLLKIRHYVGFPHAGYSLLGINNRDLKTMKTDISHTFRMLEFIDDRKVVVCESGISSAADLARLRQRGVNIVLVGEHLLRQPNPGDALRQLLGQGTDPDI